MLKIEKMDHDYIGYTYETFINRELYNIIKDTIQKMFDKKVV